MISGYFNFVKTFATKSKPKNLLVLENLLSKNLRYYPQFGPGFSNHVSMALVSLYLMNAPTSQLHKFYDSQFQNLNARKQPDFKIPQNKITEQNLTQFTNNTGKENYDDYFSFFWELQEKKGLDYTFKYAIQNFGQYCAGHLLHVIIRLQFALQIDNTEEIISSLAYMPVKANKMFQTQNKEKATFQQALKDFQKIESQLPRQTGLNVDLYLTDKLFQETYKEVVIDENTFTQISETIIRFFNKTLYLDQSNQRINFVVLHMCTGFFALKQIIKKQQKNLGPEVTNKMIQGFLQYFFGVYCLIHTPNLNDIVVESDDIANKNESGLQYLGKNYQNFPGLLSWDQIILKACDSIEEHTIKFIFVCREEAKNSPQFDILYRFAATKRLDLEL